MIGFTVLYIIYTIAGCFMQPHRSLSKLMIAVLYAGVAWYAYYSQTRKCSPDDNGKEINTILQHDDQQLNVIIVILVVEIPLVIGWIYWRHFVPWHQKTCPAFFTSCYDRLRHTVDHTVDHRAGLHSFTYRSATHFWLARFTSTWEPDDNQASPDFLNRSKSGHRRISSRNRATLEWEYIDDGEVPLEEPAEGRFRGVWATWTDHSPYGEELTGYWHENQIRGPFVSRGARNGATTARYVIGWATARADSKETSDWTPIRLLDHSMIVPRSCECSECLQEHRRIAVRYSRCGVLCYRSFLSASPSSGVLR